MSRTPKWIRRHARRPWRMTHALGRDLRWLWRNHEGRNRWGEVMKGRILWHPRPGERF